MKKRYAVKFFLLLLIIAMAMQLGGNGLVRKYQARKMVQYLNRKYSEDYFEYKRRDARLPLADHFVEDQIPTIFCSSENYPDLSVTVECIWPVRRYYDNYLGIKYAKELDTYTSALIQEFFPNHKTDHYSFYESARNCNTGFTTLPADATFEEYLAECDEMLVMAVEYPEDELDKEMIQDRIASILKEKEVGYYAMRIIFATELDPSGDFFDHKYNELDIFLDADNRIERVEWDN